MIDRRFDIRIPVGDTVTLSWTDQTGQRHQGSADMADISRSGASLRSKHPVKIGTMLSLGHKNQELSGKVTHCVSNSPGYLLGIEFEDVYRWSTRP